MNKFIELTKNASGNLATNRVSEAWFIKNDHQELWNEFLDATSLYEDLTIHQRAKLVHIGGYEKRDKCKNCDNLQGWVQATLSVCCSRECEKAIGIKKIIKPSGGKKYKETGKRVESIKKRFAQENGFDSFDDYLSKLRELIEEDRLSLIEVAEVLGIGPGTISGHCKEYGIDRITDTEAKRRGVQRKYGVDNVMDVPEIRDRQKKNLNKAFEENNDEIVQKRMDTNIERYGVPHALMNNDIKNRCEQTFLDRYGYKHHSLIPGASREQYDRVKNRYGGVHPLQQCTVTRSSGEFDIINSIKEYLPNILVEQSRRDLLKPSGFEVDIFFPEFKLGIEFGGVWAHNEDYKDKSYHQLKHILAYRNNIQLITIWDYEWRDRKEQILGFILSKLGYGTKIFGRKCIVAEIDKKTAAEFINVNHIQQITPKNLMRCVGLFYNDDLVGVMSFSSHHRDSSKISLNRLCFSKGVRVVGGPSKMLKFAISNFEYKQITTWSDFRFTEGSLYESIGFTLVDDTEFNISVYFNDSYTKDGVIFVGKTIPREVEGREYRYSLKLLTGQSKSDYNYDNGKVIIGKQTLKSFDSKSIESMNLKKIFDCGKRTWVYNT